MAKFETTFTGDFNEVLAHLEQGILNSGMTMNLVDQSDFRSQDSNIAVRVYDKYFMRNGNRASLSLTLVGYGNDVFVSAIGAGGGQGILFNFSLGAEDEMVSTVQGCVERFL